MSHISIYDLSTLNGDVPSSTFYGVHISQLIDCRKALSTAISKPFGKFLRPILKFISKDNVDFKLSCLRDTQKEITSQTD